MTLLSVDRLTEILTHPFPSPSEPIPTRRLRAKKPIQLRLRRFTIYGLPQPTIPQTPEEVKDKDGLDLRIPRSQLALPLDFPGQPEYSLMSRHFRDPQLVTWALELKLGRPGDIYQPELIARMTPDQARRFFLASLA